MASWRDCWAKSPGGKWYQRFFVCIPMWLDERTRHSDFVIHRSHGGLAERYLKLLAHSPLAYFLPALFLLFFVLGPTLGWRGWLAVGILLASYALIYLWARRRRRVTLLGLELVSIAVVAVVVWYVPLLWGKVCGSQPLEFGDRLYRHLLVPLFLLVIAVPLILSTYNARRLFKIREIFGEDGDGGALARLLPHADLLPKPEPPEFSAWKLAQAFINVPVRYPLQFVFVPSALVLSLPFPAEPKVWAAVFLLGNWFLLAVVSLHGRLTSMMNLGKRTFFVGGQLVVSLLVVVLAVGRVFEMSYVQTVVESSSATILLSYVLAAYAFFWFFEYWLSRILCEHLVALLGGADGRKTYDLRPGHPGQSGSEAESRGRAVQVHGGARLIAIGKAKEGAGEVFRTFEKPELFRALVELAGRDPETPAEDLEAAGRALRRIDRARRSYFATSNLYMVAAAVLAMLWIFKLEPQYPVAVVPSAEPECAATNPADLQRVDLRQEIWGAEEGEEREEREERERVVLLAASGGGSRAALYTQSVLQGLAGVGALEDLVLASGVSGGGAALAYFAARREELSAGADTWKEFSCDFSYPFIWDVLRGAVEWRVVMGERLGRLLEESLARRFYRGPCGGARSGNRCMGQLSDLGLILNTTLAGSLSLCDFCDDCTDEEFAKAASGRAWRGKTRGRDAGGRLILTNLRHFEPGVPPGEPMPDGLELPYVKVDDPLIALPEAAALTANFPPVFSNAALDAYRRDRYWVTDGGATDNRGMISLLLALRTAMDDWKEKPLIDAESPPAHNDSTGEVGESTAAAMESVAEQGEEDPGEGSGAVGQEVPEVATRPRELPAIHIVMADASAGSTRYVQDRGVGSKFGATGKVAGQLIAELLSDVGERYEALGGKLVFHDLSMPEFLRIDGGLGTHWMLPHTVKMQVPVAGGGKRTLDTFAARAVISALHGRDGDLDLELCPGEKVGWRTLATRWMWENIFGERTREQKLAEVDGWLRASEHRKSWNCLCRELTGQECLPGPGSVDEAGTSVADLAPFDCRSPEPAPVEVAGAPE